MLIINTKYLAKYILIQLAILIRKVLELRTTSELKIQYVSYNIKHINENQC